MTERLDRIEASIQQLSNTIDVLTQQLIAPAVRQASANFERLEQMTELFSLTAEQSAISEQQIAANAEAISNNASAIAANERRFENLLNESRADRAESRQRFEAAQENIQALLLELTRTNRSLNGVRDRVDGLGGRVDSLEQAS